MGKDSKRTIDLVLKEKDEANEVEQNGKFLCSLLAWPAQDFVSSSATDHGDVGACYTGGIALQFPLLSCAVVHTPNTDGH
jgi:hypothetical protein